MMHPTDGKAVSLLEAVGLAGNDQERMSDLTMATLADESSERMIIEAPS